MQNKMRKREEIERSASGSNLNAAEQRRAILEVLLDIRESLTVSYDTPRDDSDYVRLFNPPERQ